MNVDPSGYWSVKVFIKNMMGFSNTFGWAIIKFGFQNLRQIATCVTWFWAAVVTCGTPIMQVIVLIGIPTLIALAVFGVILFITAMGDYRIFY